MSFINHHSGLGLEFAKMVPRDREEYRKWLEEKRRELDVLIEEKTNSKGYVDDGNRRNIYTKSLSRTRPLPNLWIDWIYVIDFDREVFHGMWTPICHL